MTMTEQVNTLDYNDSQGHSEGEKLFLAHLDSYLEADGDSHHLQKQQTTSEESTSRRMSIGEELWIVHCKRSEGVVSELEDDNNCEQLLIKKPKIAYNDHSTNVSDREICLRSRNIKIA
jgi:hypothetical protein